MRAVRMLPMLHHYPFRPWVVGEWLTWLAARRIPLWLPMSYETNWLDGDGAELDSHAVYETVSEFSDLAVVLSEVHYRQASWAPPLLTESAEPVDRGLPLRDRGRNRAAAG